MVERFTDLGRRWSDRSVLRPDGSKAGMLRRAAPPALRPTPGIKSMIIRDHTKNDVVELVDDRQAVVLTLIRPIGAKKISVEVRDSEGRDAGRIVQQSLRRNETTFAFLGPNGQFLGDLQTDNWVAWDLRIMDSHGRQVATITRDWAGPRPHEVREPRRLRRADLRDGPRAVAHPRRGVRAQPRDRRPSGPQRGLTRRSAGLARSRLLGGLLRGGLLGGRLLRGGLLGRRLLGAGRLLGGLLRRGLLGGLLVLVSSSRSSKISEPLSPRAFLAASTERCSAASRSTTSPEVLVEVGVRLISPPSILVLTRVSTAPA